MLLYFIFTTSRGEKMREDLIVIKTNYTRDFTPLLKKNGLKKKRLHLWPKGDWLYHVYKRISVGITIYWNTLLQRLQDTSLRSLQAGKQRSSGHRGGLRRRDVSLDWVRRPGSSLWLCHLLAVGPRACQVASLRLFPSSCGIELSLMVFIALPVLADSSAPWV